MSKRQYWMLKVKTGEALNPPRPSLWCPAFIFYKCDDDQKGFALFTSKERAEAFSVGIEGKCNLPREVAQFSACEFIVAAKVHAVRHDKDDAETTVLRRLPVYLDPPDPWCVGEANRPAHRHLLDFLRKRLRSQVRWNTTPVKWYEYRGCTVCVLTNNETGQYLCKTARGLHTNMCDLDTAIEDDLDTTKEKYCVVTEDSSSIEAALASARAELDAVCPGEERARG